jgi:RNA polymerase sigma-70 factor (ECF subfamily)
LELSDRELVAAVLAGRRDRFEPLIARHGAALWSYLRRRTRDREVARELYQETLLRAFRGLFELREVERLRAWLISIAHNTLRQRLRRAGLEPLTSEDADGAFAKPEDDALELSEFAERAEREIARLSTRQREIFELRVRQELTHAEIAALLDISEENSRAHYHQAVRNLRARLGEESP